jgi:Domain of unknown function (DUF6431)
VAQAPLVVIIWLYALSSAAYVSAGQQLVVPPQRCPTCSRWLIGWGGYWRWLRAPLLVERIWIRRGRCRICRRSHAMLPDLLVARRLDVVAVIGSAVDLKVTTELGLRSVAEQLDVPHTIVRSWWPRFSAALGEQVDGSGDYGFATACLHPLVGQARPGLQDQLSIDR